MIKKKKIFEGGSKEYNLETKIKAIKNNKAKIKLTKQPYHQQMSNNKEKNKNRSKNRRKEKIKSKNKKYKISQIIRIRQRR